MTHEGPAPPLQVFPFAKSAASRVQVNASQEDVLTPTGQPRGFVFSSFANAYTPIRVSSFHSRNLRRLQSTPAASNTTTIPSAVDLGLLQGNRAPRTTPHSTPLLRKPRLF